MDFVAIEPTYETPGVVLDPQKGVIEFSGKSFPENVSIFYEPIIKWINEYTAMPLASTEVNFRFEYFNTASSKKILDILMVLKDLSDEGKEVKVNWYYDADDDEMMNAGVEYSDIIEMPMNTIPVSQ